jgi:hypothetical protein
MAIVIAFIITGVDANAADWDTLQVFISSILVNVLVTVMIVVMFSHIRSAKDICPREAAVLYSHIK